MGWVGGVGVLVGMGDVMVWLWFEDLLLKLGSWAWEKWCDGTYVEDVCSSGATWPTSCYMLARSVTHSHEQKKKYET